ncbi:MAG: hypothetical protein ACRCYU_00330, partial [Nocardioides sp.]
MRSSVLAGRFARRLRLAPGALGVLLVVTFAFASNVFLDSQTLSPRQAASWQLGQSQGLVRLSQVPAPAGEPVRDDLEAGLSSAGWAFSLQHYDFPAPSVARD